MAVSSSDRTRILNDISSGYVDRNADKEKTGELGREEFLTLLVAQLQNQDPLNPAEGTDFTSQLAQYSQLEQLMNMNESMANLSTALTDEAKGDGVDYIGKEVTGDVKTINVSSGSVTSGFYSLESSADVVVDIYDEAGNKVKRLYEGQKSAGGQLLSWDGTDMDDKNVDDGKYTYVVMADYGQGYETVSTLVSGTVDGVTNNNGIPYLVVQGVLVSLDDIVSVTEISTESDKNIMEYLGKNVKTNAPIVHLKDGEVAGGDLTFQLDLLDEDEAKPVTVKIYDAYNELVKTIEIDADKLQEGENSVAWDGKRDPKSQDDSNLDLPDGLYYYTVSTDAGKVGTEVAGTISAIRTVNNTQYLVFEDSGRLVAVSKVTEIS